MGEAARKLESNDFADGHSNEAIRDAFDRARPSPIPANDAPLPLRRALRDGSPYPVEALGGIMAKAVAAAADIISAPLEMCAQSALANAALAVQGHANTIKPWSGKPGPISLFLLTVAQSGDRKTTADDALGGDAIAEFEQLREDQTDRDRQRYEAEKEAHDIARQAVKTKAAKGDVGIKVIADQFQSLGPPPEPPLTATLTFGDPTIEGMHKHFASGQPSSGLFSTEGGAFVGGVGMSAENALKTSAQFSELWDGLPIKRNRSGDGVLVLRGRRLCFHLMMQPGAAHGWLSNPVIRDQGLFSRLLVAAPKSLAGTRFHREPGIGSKLSLAAFNRQLGALLEHPLPIDAERRGVLTPRSMELDVDARSLLTQFSDSIEAQMGEDGHLNPVNGLAAKIGDHAVRLASVVGLFEDLSLTVIDRGLMARGIKLAQWYLGEALRLTEAEAFHPDLLNAEKALSWLTLHAPGGLFSLPCLYMRGPNALRTKDAAKRAVSILIEHRCVEPVEGRHKISEQMRSECFRVRGEA